MRKGLPLFLCLVLSLPLISFSQELNGRVRNEYGGNAGGVTVQFRNRANTISTNADGTFKITASRLPDTLDFSGPGMEPYQVVVTEKNIKDPNFEVVLLNKRSAKSEVVATGLAASKKEEVFADTRVTLRGIRSDFAAGYSASGMEAKYYFRDTQRVQREGILVKSSILTAGEINDFNKWKMWEDFSEHAFRNYSSFWGMNADHRFSIQVLDKKNNAVINEPVFLLDKNSNDTVWKAFTDNTGKAELWAGFFRDSSRGKKNSNDYKIVDRFGNAVNQLADFSKGVNTFITDRPCQVSNDVDIAFVVDATGSMGDEIEFLKLELEDVIRHTMDKYTHLSLRVSSVFYRDKRDEYLVKQVAFSDDLLKPLNFIKMQSAAGGGDYPEAVDDALGLALDSLAWNSGARTRLLFLVLDAPPHSQAKQRIQSLTFKAAAMGVRIIPVVCSGTDKSTEFLMRSIALATNGTYAFLTNHSGVGGAHIEPTTDKYEVELLNNLLRRTIAQFLYAKECGREESVLPDTRQPENILSVRIFPNPTNGKFVIESKNELREIFIADFTGKILLRLPMADKKGRWQVDISRFPSGTYVVKYVTIDNRWGAEKVVVVR